MFHGVKMETKELAKQLGISHQLCNRDRKRGMPDSLEGAIAWRKSNIDPFRSKNGRIGGNSGVKYQSAKETESKATERAYSNAEIKIIEETLTRIVPKLWFSQIGRLGRALQHNNVKVQTEKLVKIQSALFLMWMIEIDEYLETESCYEIPFSLAIKPSDEAYPSLIHSLNKILCK